MAGKLYNLYTLPASFYLEDAPVIISEGSLFLNCRSEDLSVCLRLKSVSEHEISSVAVCIIPFDAKGAPIGDIIQYSYSLLKLKRDDQFGGRKYIPAPEKGTRSFSVYISQVIFADYSTWENSEPFIPVGSAVPLEAALEDREVTRQFAARYGNDCKYMPYTDRDLWFCTCGAVNLLEEERCHSCKRNRTAFQSINISTLTKEAKRRTEREQREAEIQKNEKEIRQKKNKTILKWTMIILPILLVIALVAATVPSFLSRREAYVSAGILLEKGKFDEAREVYADLGDYLDSAEMAEKGVSYEKAVFVLNCAETNDMLALKDLGITVEDLDESEMGVYLKAKELFAELGDYKDAPEKITQIDTAFADHEEKKRQDAYDLATDQLEQNKYLSARDAFSALGNYKDAPDMAKESLYRRASSLLEFCKSNNIRGIYVDLSDNVSKKTAISMPGSVLTSLGSDAIYALKMCCYADGVEFLYEDKPEGNDFQPICTVVAKEFESLKGYKDSEALSQEAKACGDFSAEFYALLKAGELKKALDWLNTFDDEIPDRDSYPEWIENYLNYCQSWELYQGDSGLIPYSAGAEGVRMMSFTPWITIDGDTATMHIEADDGSFSTELTADLGDTGFVAYNDDWSFYYVTINQVNHFIYMRYSNQGAVLTSCEYNRAD